MRFVPVAVPTDPPRPLTPAPGTLWPRATLRSYLVGVILAATVPLALLTAFRIVDDGRQQRDVLFANLRSGAKAVAVGVDRELVASIDTLRVLGQSDSLARGEIAGFERRLRERGTLRPAWNRIALLGADGALLAEVELDGRRAPGASNERAALAQAARAGAPDGSVVLSVLDGPPAERAVWVGARAGPPGGARYLLAARIGLDAWQAQLGGAAPEGGGFATLFDAEHRVLARTLAPERFAGATLPPEAIAAMAGQPAGVRKSALLGGGETYVAWQRLSHGGWGVGVGMPADPFDAAQDRAVLVTFGVAAACLLLGVAAALAVARRVTRPLDRLTAAEASPGGPPSEVTEIAQLREAFELLERQRSEAAARLAKEVEREQLARRDAEAANRAKDELLAMLGHELRNPLNAIVTSVEVLRRAEAGSDLAASARAVVARQTQRLAAMVDGLLDVGQLMAGEVTLQTSTVELAELVRAAVAAAQATAGARGQHLLVGELARVWICAEPRRIGQVLTQLLDNAVKYTPEDGAIRVDLREHGGSAVLRIADTGPGVAPELLARIFEPFVQGERGLARSAGGLGIGLTLVRRLVELHGGTIRAETSADGTTFEVRLPAIAPPDAAGVACSRRVGVIDDNPDALTGMRSMLELAGHSVRTAADGTLGLAMLLAERPDVAIVDIGLPGLDGYEVARRCRAAGFAGRLIAMSGYGQQRDLQRSLAEGCFDAYLVKPVDPDQLMPLLHGA